MAKKASSVEAAEGAVAAPARRRTQATATAQPERKSVEKNGHEKNGTPAERNGESSISGTQAAVKVLKRRKNKEMTAGDLFEACKDVGWHPEGKTPKQTLVAAIQNEIKRKQEKARFARGSEPGTWKLSEVGMAG